MHLSTDACMRPKTLILSSCTCAAPALRVPFGSAGGARVSAIRLFQALLTRLGTAFADGAPCLLDPEQPQTCSAETCADSLNPALPPISLRPRPTSPTPYDMPHSPRQASGSRSCCNITATGRPIGWVQSPSIEYGAHLVYCWIAYGRLSSKMDSLRGLRIAK